MSDTAALKAAFEMFDKDGSGGVDVAELQALAYASGRVLTDDQAAALLKELDTDGSGAIEFDEWCAWFSKADGSDAGGADGSTDAPFTSVSAELRLLRGRLMADYGLRVLESYVDAAPEATDLAAGSGDDDASAELAKLKGTVRAGAAAQADAEGGMELLVTLRDAAVGERLVASAAEQLAAKKPAGGAAAGAAAGGGEGGSDGGSGLTGLPAGHMCAKLTFSVADGEDAGKIAEALTGAAGMVPPNKVPLLNVTHDSDSVSLLAVFGNPKGKKVSGLVKMASLKTLALTVGIWPKPSRERTAKEDISMKVQAEVELPKQIIDLFKSKPGLDSKKLAFLTLMSSLQEAGLSLDFADGAALLSMLDKSGKVVEGGGWALLHQKVLQAMSGMIGMMPPIAATAYESAVTGLQAITSVDVCLADGVTIGIDAKNFDIFPILPCTEDLEAFAAQQEE